MLLGIGDDMSDKRPLYEATCGAVMFGLAIMFITSDIILSERIAWSVIGAIAIWSVIYFPKASLIFQYIFLLPIFAILIFPMHWMRTAAGKFLGLTEDSPLVFQLLPYLVGCALGIGAFLTLFSAIEMLGEGW